MFSMFFLPSSCATTYEVMSFLFSNPHAFDTPLLHLRRMRHETPEDLTSRPGVSRCITWCFWSDSDSDNVISSKRPVLASFCLEDAEKSKQNHGAGGIGVSRIHKLCELSEWKAIHIQLSYDCPGFKLINSPMMGTMRSSEKIWQDIP